MNRYNDWENLLRISNEDLAQYGYSIKLTDYYKDGCYTCEVMKDGISVEVYAENFYEDELDELVNEAWYYIKANKC